MSDGEPCFKSEVLKEFLESHHIMHHITSAYHSSAAGLVEKGIRSLKDILKKVNGPVKKE